MSDDEKAAFDKERTALQESRNEEFDKLKKAAGYDDDNCDQECKAFF